MLNTMMEHFPDHELFQLHLLHLPFELQLTVDFAVFTETELFNNP